MAKKTPLQIVKDRYGSKDKLIEAVAALVERDEGETEDEHKKRLEYVSNAKLLHLVGVAEQAKALGGRDGMVDKVLALKGQPKDHEYRDKLKTLPLGRLLDLTRSLSRKAINPQPEPPGAQ
jgi:hypothetical protein